MPVYTYQGKKWNIPEDKVEKFLHDIPGANLYEQPRQSKLGLAKAGALGGNLQDPNPYTENFLSDEERAANEEYTTRNPKTGTSFDNIQPGISMQSKPVGHLDLPQSESIKDTNKDIYDLQKAKRNEKDMVKSQLSTFQEDLQSKIKERDSIFDEEQKKKDQGKSTAMRVFETPNPYSGFISGSDGDATNYRVAEHFVNEAQNLINNVESDAGILKGVKDTAFNPDTWLLGLGDLYRSGKINQIVDKHEKGEELTDSENSILDALALNMAANAYHQAPRQYKWGQIAGESLPFMVEFILNPVAGAGKGIAKTIAKRAISKFGATGAAKTAIKAGSRVVGDVIGAAGMTTTTGAPKTIADALNRNLGQATFDLDENGKITYTGHEGGEDAVTSAFKAVGANLLEYQSEMLGSSGLGALTGKVIPKGITKTIKASDFGRFAGRMKNSTLYRETKALMQRGQWSGTIGEYGEEVYNQITNSLFIGDNKLSDLTNIDEQVDIFMGLALTGGVMGTVNTGAYVIDRTRTANQLRQADSEASQYIANWDGIKDQLANLPVEERSQTIKDVLGRNDLTVPAKKAFADYTRTLTYRDALLGAAGQKMEDDRTEAEQNGRELAIDDKRRNLLSNLNREKIELESKLGDLANIPEDQFGEYIETGTLTDEQINDWNTYNQRRNEYNGLVKQLREEIDKEIEPAIQDIKRVTRPDGNIIYADFGSEGTLPVVNGNISINEDGTIDRQNTDNSLTVLMPDGKKRIISSKFINGNPLVNTPAELEEEVRQNAYDIFVSPIEEAMNGTERFTEGTPVEYVDEKGQAQAGSVVSTQGNTVTVVPNDGNKSKIRTFTHEQLRNSLVKETLGDVQVRDEFSIDIPEGYKNIRPGQYSVQVEEIKDGTAILRFVAPGETDQYITDATIDDINTIRPAVVEMPMNKVPAEQPSQDVSEAQITPQEQSIPEIQEQTDETPVPFIDQIPKGEKGTLIFEQAPVETTVGALSEVYEDQEELAEVVKATISNIQKQIEKAKTPKPTGDINKDIANKQAAKQQLVDLNNKLEYWNSVQTGITPEKSSYESRMDAIELGNAKERESNMGEYLSLRDYLLRNIGTGKFKFLWNSNEGKKGLKDEILSSKNTEAERRKRIAFLDNKGYTPESLAEELFENAGQGSEINPGWFNDTQDIRNEIIDILLSNDTPTSMIDAATELRRQPESIEEYYENFVDPALIAEYEANEISQNEMLRSIPDEELYNISDQEIEEYFEKNSNFEYYDTDKGTGTIYNQPDVDTSVAPSEDEGRSRGNVRDGETEIDDSGEYQGEAFEAAERSTQTSLVESSEEGGIQDHGGTSDSTSGGLNVRIVDYSDKSIAIYGDTKPIKDDLKSLGGRFNPKLKDGPGWIFPKSKESEVANLLEKNDNFVENQDYVRHNEEQELQDDQRAEQEAIAGREENARAARRLGRYRQTDRGDVQDAQSSRSEQEKDLREYERKLEDLYGGNEAIGRTIEEARISRGDDRTPAQAGQSGGTRESLLGQIVRRAQEDGTWIDDIQAVATGEYIGHGQEHEVYRSNDGAHVIKLNNLDFLPDNASDLNDFINRALTQNTLFPSDSFTIIGFAYNSKGQTSVVLRQPYVIPEREATDAEIDKFLEDHGFTVDIRDVWTDGKYEITDLKTSNVLIDTNGRMRFIDVVAKDVALFNQEKTPVSPKFTGDLPQYLREIVKNQELSREAEKVDPNPSEAQKDTASVVGPREKEMQADKDGTGVVDNSTAAGATFDELEKESETGIPASENTYGSSNTLISPDQYEELRKRMREKLNNLNMGFDPELFTIGTQMAMYHIEAGARKFADFAKRMIEDLGESVRPYLKSFYESARHMPGMENIAPQMDSPSAVKSADVNNLDAKKEKKGEKKGDISKQLSIFGEDINNNNHARILQTNSKRLPERTSSGVLQGTEGSERTGRSGDQQGEELSRPDGAQQRSGDGQGGILQGYADVLSEQPALVEFEPESNDVESFNKTKKYADNISAIETLLSILKEKRKATPEEKIILSKYVGFGGLKEILLDPENNSAWKKGEDKYRDSVRRTIELAKQFDEATGTSDALSKIRGSILNAHYTSQTVIEAIYKGLNKLGFKGGSILEPSAGIGNFITYMPESIKGKSNISAVELDNLTGNILKAIHDNTYVQISGIETANIAPGSQDLVISNVPFGNYKVYDRIFKGEKEQFQNRIHNYFFAKALDQVRDGGLIAFVTSKGVLDSPGNANIREYLNKNAEFLGAVRLPNTTFKNTANTEVVTDVIFLRKTNNPTNPDFVNVAEVEAKHRDGETENVTVNQYFIDNPQNMLGEIEAGGMYDRRDYTLKDNGSSKDLAKAVRDALPANIYTKSRSAMGLQANDLTKQFENVKEGDIAFASDGQLYRKEEGITTEIKINEPETKIKDYINLRDALMNLIYSEYANLTPSTVAENRQRLNDEYDKFVKQYGKLEKSISKIVKQDADGYNVLSLENNEEKADIFTKRTISPVSIKTRAESIDEAIIISLSETAGVDMERIAQLMGMSIDEVKQASKSKIFERPEGGYVTRDEYLSGNVKQKLSEAKQAAESGFTEFQNNIEELERVIPADIPAIQIEARLGSRWIPASIYTQFARELLKDDDLSISYSPGVDQFFINDRSRTVEATQKYGTDRVNGADILLSALHINPPKVYDYHKEDGKQVRELNKDETDKAVQKYQDVRDAFEDWVYKTSDRRELLSGIYNAKFNTTVKRKYDGAHLSVPGINSVTLRPHQKDAIWMLLQNNGGVIDHLVGAGKTYVMVAGTMEMKRTGVSKKPMIIALKSTIPQIVETYRSAYPMAKILAPMEKDFEKDNRRKLFSKIANNEWDVIIMSHENYGKIPHERDIQERLIKQELKELEDERIEFEINNDRAAQKGLEIRIKNLNARLEKLSDISKDNSLTFEQMGIDHLMVDESQQFKNLSYITKQRGIAGLGNAEGSKRSFNLLVGIRYLQDKLNGDKGTTFLSGTPITNSIVEMYSLLNYLRPTKMAELGFTSFDAWATTFANPTTDIEFTVTGNFKQKTRFREFMNVPELSILYTEIADIRTDENLKLDKPKMKGNGYTVVEVQMSEDQKEFSERLMKFAETKDGTLIGRGELSDNEKSAAMLLATNLSSKMAIDMRLINSSYSYDPNGKIAKLVDNVAKTFNETNNYKGTQLIFSDLGTPKNVTNKSALLRDYLEDEIGLNIDTLNEIFGDTGVANYRYPAITTVRNKLIDTLELTEEESDQIIRDSENSVGSFDVYNEIKKRLIENGVPEDQIVFIHDYNTDRKKEALFKKVNDGQIRIILGSTQKLGTGVNVQERVVAVHHIDVPWTPASMEQRNGRALRQGNLVVKEFFNNELPVYAYATERTLDAYKYQLLQTKQTFLNQVKSGEVTERVIKEGEGDSESGVGYAELVAMLSGNQDILQKSRLEEKLARLKRAKRNFEGELYEAIEQKRRIEERTPEIEENIKKSEQNVKSLTDKAQFDEIDKLIINSFNGEQLKPKKEKGEEVPVERTDYAKAALEYIENRVKKMEFGEMDKIEIGGYNLEFYIVPAGDAGLFSTSKKANASLVAPNGVKYAINVSTIPGVFLNNIQKAITDQIPNALRSQISLLEREKKNLDSYNEIIERGEAWPRQEEMDDIVKELREVAERLNAETKSNEKDEITDGDSIKDEYIAQEINIAYGGKEKRDEAITKSLEYIDGRRVEDSQEVNDEENGYNERRGSTSGSRLGGLLRRRENVSRQSGKNKDVDGRFTLTPRTVRDGFAESGYVDIIGTKIQSVADIADLFTIHRSPYIEKTHIIFVRSGEIIGTSAMTDNKIDMASVHSIKNIAELYHKFGANGVYMLHNHPSGNHKVSMQDVYTAMSSYYELQNEGINLMGSIVIDHDKFSFINTAEKPMDFNTVRWRQLIQDYIDSRVEEIEYKNAVPKLFTHRERLGTGEETSKRLFEISKALLTDKGYKGAIIYLSSDLSISGYDVFPENFTREIIIGMAKDGIANNLGNRAAFVHDGTVDIEWGTLPVQIVDVINADRYESDYFDNEETEETLSPSVLWTAGKDGVYYPGNIVKEREEEYKRADTLMDNADNLKKVVNYPKFLTDVLNGPAKEKLLSEAREKGYTNLNKVIENYLAEVEDPEELKRIKELLGAEIPDNALRYLLWRNTNPNDGTPKWKAMDAVKTHSLNDNILFQPGKVSDSAISEYERRVRSRHNRGFKSLMTGLEEGWFDRMKSLKILQDAIMKGRDIPDRMNAYLLENQLSSKNTSEIRTFNKLFIDPMIEAAQKIFGRDIATLDNYLNAKHGLERNEYMARQQADAEKNNQLAKLREKEEKMELTKEKYETEKQRIDEHAEKRYEYLLKNRDYSGLTAIAEERDQNETFTEAAENIVKEVEENYPEEDIKALWEAVNKANKWMLRKQYDSGMMTREVYEKVSSMYQYYVPLRGFAETTAEEVYEYLENETSDFNKVLRKAYGRTSKAESPFANMISMGESGIMQANKNSMKQAFYRLVASNPSNLAKINDAWYVESGNEWIEKFPKIPENADGDQVAEIIQDFNEEMVILESQGKAVKGRNKLNLGMKIGKGQASEHAVRVWIGGEEKVIYINGNPRAAQAINGLTNSSLVERSNARRQIEFWGRQMAANFTSRNPAFMVTNFMRDIQFALVSAAIKEGGMYSFQLAANAVKAPKTIAMNVFGNGGGQFDKYWKEFTLNGGETGYANLNSIDHHRKYVNKKLREFSGQRDLILPFRAYVSFMENSNRLVEDISRFATYVTSRQNGRSIERSVSDAKEITINFNRKGSGRFGASWIHSFYLFSNPALQGLRLMGMLAKNHPVRFTAAMASTLAMGYFAPILNEILLGLFGDDDDKEKYWNLSDWTRRNNLVLYAPWTKDKFLTFPLPHELRPFYGMGEIIHSYQKGNMITQNPMQEIAKQFTAILPIDPFAGQNWRVPSAVLPVWESYVSNSNFTGAPVYKDTPWNKLDPEWTKAYKSTPKPLIEGAKWLNEVSGGDDVVKGKIDINPARMAHVFRGYMGGFLTTYTDLANVSFNLITGNDLSINDIPVANKLIRTSDDRTESTRINQEYYYYLDWITDYEHRQRGYKGKTREDREYIKKYINLIRSDEKKTYMKAKRQINHINKIRERDPEAAEAAKKRFVEEMREINK